MLSLILYLPINTMKTERMKKTHLISLHLKKNNENNSWETERGKKKMKERKIRPRVTEDNNFIHNNYALLNVKL